MTAWTGFPKTASRPGPAPEPPPEQHDHGSLWDCLTCSLYLEDPPPPPPGGWVAQPDVRPRWWESKGPLAPEFDPCGAGPIRARSDEGEAA